MLSHSLLCKARALLPSNYTVVCASRRAASLGEPNFSRAVERFAGNYWVTAPTGCT